MKIGLFDIDGHNFPNLALMKISAYHKSHGDKVEWGIPMLQYDKAYMSKVFDASPDLMSYPVADAVEKGGRAYDKKKILPECIEGVYPDYGLYNIKDEAYGYLTRGCPRGCEFCDVCNIEGKISHKVSDLRQFWNTQRNIKLLDPNLLACKDKTELLQQLIDSKAWVDFTQGLDIRLMTEEIAYMLMQIKVKLIHFAWDKMDNNSLIERNLESFQKQTGYDMRKLQVYVLTNFNTTLEQDLYRVYRLRELGYTPYIMIYDKAKAPRQIRHLQRWVNNKIIFRTCDRFEDYKPEIA